MSVAASKGTRDGIRVALAALVSNPTAMDSLLFVSGGARKSALAAMFSAVTQPSAPFMTNWTTIPLTFALGSGNGIVQTGTQDCSADITGVGHYLSDLLVEFTMPPIANVLKNTSFDGSTLGFTEGSIIGADLTAGAGGGALTSTFAVNDAVTILAGTGGPGTGFAATVATETAGRITSLNITNTGSGYTAPLTFRNAGAGRQVSATPTLAPKLTTFPPPHGRVVLPRTGSAAVAGIAGNHSLANYDNLGNSIMAENATAIATKSVAGVTFGGSPESNIERARSGGLSTADFAAYYCRHLPSAMIQSVEISDGNGVAWPVMLGKDFLAYHLFFDEKPVSDRYSFRSADPAELKRLSLQPVVVRARVPCSFFHSIDQAFPIAGIAASKLVAKVTFNGWASALMNAPAYNANLTLTPAASALTVLREDDDLVASLHTPHLDLRTVANGRFTTAQSSIVTKTSATQCTPPTTELTNSMFQASLRAQFVHLPDAEATATFISTFSRTQVVTTFQQVHAPLTLSPTDVATNLETLSLPRKITCKLPTAYLLVFPQLPSNVAQNDTMNFRGPLDPLGATLEGRHAQGGYGPEVFSSIQLSFSSHNVVDTDAAGALSHAAGRTPRGPDYSDGIWLLPFTTGNPFATSKQQAVSMTLQSSNQKIAYVPNPAAFADYQWIGGLPAQNVTLASRTIVYNEMLIDSDGSSIIYAN